MSGYVCDEATNTCQRETGTDAAIDANVDVSDSPDPPPVAKPVALALGGALDLFEDQSHSCAIFDDGSAQCWGDAGSGQLGYGLTTNVGDDESPADAGVVDLGGSAVQIAAGNAHTCALLSNGELRCWGRNYLGHLGYGHTTVIGDNEAPAAAGAVGVGTNALQVAAGFSHTCAVLEGGSVRCWGFGEWEQDYFGSLLGIQTDDRIGDDEAPSSVAPVSLGENAVQVTAGYAHSCALLENGAVRCWGENASGQLGYANELVIGDDEHPSSIAPVNIGGDVTQVAAGGLHTCALVDDGTVRCWGQNGDGQLGYGHTNDIGDDEHPSAAGAVSLGATVTQIALGGFHTCALLTGGEVRCWGNNDFGQLGYGNTTRIGDTELPSSVGPVSLGGNALFIAAGYRHTCALLEDGAVRCWGENNHGQLGYGNSQPVGDNELPHTVNPVNLR